MENIQLLDDFERKNFTLWEATFFCHQIMGGGFLVKRESPAVERTLDLKAKKIEDAAMF